MIPDSSASFKDHLQEVDLREFDGGKFITASEAEGADVTKLAVEGFNIPVSLSFKEGRFRINGLEQTTKEGVIASGIMGDNRAKINHILVDGNLRGGKVSSALLGELESRLKGQLCEELYAVFFNPATIKFFIKNGYEIVDAKLLAEEAIKDLKIDLGQVDERVHNQSDFESIDDTKTLKHIVLKKVL